MNFKDWEKVIQLSERIRERMIESGIVADVNSDYRPGMPEFQILPDRHKAAQLGIPIQRLAFTVNVVNGSLNTNTRVYARGACAGTVQSMPAPFCNYGNTANALGDDPGYAPAVSQPPAHQSLPACTTPNSVVTFQPGYYDDDKGLSDNTHQ